LVPALSSRLAEALVRAQELLLGTLEQLSANFGELRGKLLPAGQLGDLVFKRLFTFDLSSTKRSKLLHCRRLESRSLTTSSSCILSDSAVALPCSPPRKPSSQPSSRAKRERDDCNNEQAGIHRHLQKNGTKYEHIRL
jgi:hypothetical protein